MTSEETSRPYRTIWRLAWPQALMMFFHFWIGFVDVYVAGLMNREVQAALGLITSCLFFLLIIAISVANGSVAAISQSLGAGLTARARRYVGLCLEIGALGGLLFMVGGVAAKDLLLAALHVPMEIRGITAEFLDVYALLLPSYYLLVITNAVFRARKEVMIPTATMLVITVVNALADFGLGLGLWGLPRLEHQGLAWATFWSVSAGALVNLFMLWRKGLLNRKTFPPLRWVRAALPYLMKVAWPSGLMQIFWQTGYLVLFAIAASLPVNSVNALAGMTAGLRIEAILFLAGFAFNMTASVLVGNYLGAGEPATAKRFGYMIWGIGVVSIGLLTLVVWQFVAPIAALMSTEVGVRVQIESYLFYNLLAIPFTLTSMIIGGALNGAGATLYNTAVFGVTVWCVRLPLAWYLGHVLIAEASGIWMAMLCSQAVQAFLILWVYQFKDWSRFGMIQKRNKVQPLVGVAPAGVNLRK
ncbi:MATE family efflux transporter [Desulfovibrio ferrophilus]|uniref:Multidrug-efflux transporter n=1 Tax=Desulfovibrio ferrophilus TaxID=241368 RepID=A0A2Z6B2S6_9BACT|nr:MATE family efflux transporter [Desulfovibrio ferrophilus]BBD09819.1 MATE efflux family protein [Desulfovibrio ferrophilus]